MAEKASKFKVDTESSGRSKSSQPPSRKTSKEKRPSMCVEMYNSSRIRGSYGNIHNNFHRSHFGANRAVSLDAQCQSRRMSSDGIQSVISDSSVFYHVHNNCNNAINNNNNNSCSNHHFSGNNNNININASINNNNHPVTHPHHSSCINTTNATATHDPEDGYSPPTNPQLILAGEGSSPRIHHQPPPPPSSEESVAAHAAVTAGAVVGEKAKVKKPKREFRFRSLRGSTVASSSSQPPPPTTTTTSSQQLLEAIEKSENNASHVRQFSAANAAAATNPPLASGSRSFIARLRQLTGKFSFSFNHGFTSSSSSSAPPSPLHKIPSVSPVKVSSSATTAATTTAALSSSNKNVNLHNAQAESTKNLNNKMLLSKQLCHIAYVQNKHPAAAGQGSASNLQRSPNASKIKNLDDTGVVVCTQPGSGGCVRNRAYSLDVPTKRYSSGSSSRKSSTSNKNEEETTFLPLLQTNNNNGTCITCSFCSAELVINAEGNGCTAASTGARVRHININVNNLSGGCDEGGGSAGDVAHICDEQCEGGVGSGGFGSCSSTMAARRKASDGENEVSRLMNNRMPSNNNFNNSSSSNSNLSKNVNI